MVATHEFLSITRVGCRRDSDLPLCCVSRDSRLVRFTRDFATIKELSADVASLLHATGILALGIARGFRRPEGELFPGLRLFFWSRRVRS